MLWMDTNWDQYVGSKVLDIVSDRLVQHMKLPIIPVRNWKGGLHHPVSIPAALDGERRVGLSKKSERFLAIVIAAVVVVAMLAHFAGAE